METRREMGDTEEETKVRMEKMQRKKWNTKEDDIKKK